MLLLPVLETLLKFVLARSIFSKFLNASIFVRWFFWGGRERETEMAIVVMRLESDENISG